MHGCGERVIQRISFERTALNSPPAVRAIIGRGTSPSAARMDRGLLRLVVGGSGNWKSIICQGRAHKICRSNVEAADEVAVVNASEDILMDASV